MFERQMETVYFQSNAIERNGVADWRLDGIVRYRIAAAEARRLTMLSCGPVPLAFADEDGARRLCRERRRPTSTFAGWRRRRGAASIAE
jgi:hypothetical protein